MADEDVTPTPPPPRQDDHVRRSRPEPAGRPSRLSADAEAYLDVVLPRLEAERYEILWGERGFDCVATLSRFEITKCGFADYTVVFYEFDRLDRRSLWAFSADAFSYAESRGGMAMPGLQGARFCFPVAMTHADAGAVDSVRETQLPWHFASFEFPCVFDLEAGELHCYQRTPILGYAYYAGMRKMAARLLGP